MTAEDLRYAAWKADAAVVYIPPTLAESREGVPGRYVAVELPPVQGGARP